MDVRRKHSRNVREIEPSLSCLRERARPGEFLGRGRPCVARQGEGVPTQYSERD